MSASDPRNALAPLIAFERRLLVSVADRIARAPSLPVKMSLCRAVWDGACRVRALLRALPAEAAEDVLASTPDDQTQALVAALTATGSEAGYVAGLCGVVAPFAVAAYAEARARIEGTGIGLQLGRAARQFRGLARDRWGARPARAGTTSRAVDRLRPLAAHGRISLDDGRENESSLRTCAELSEPARERVIRALRYGEASEETWFVSSPAEHHRYLHQLIAFEINTFEAVSRHVAEYASMPWEFHFDMARQIRDELAHLEMWLERLPRAGGRLGMHPLAMHEYAVCRGHDLPGRVALLERLIESSALDSLDLNRCLWETRADAVMVGYLGRVQMDEIAHVRHGNKWLRRLCGTDAAINALVDRAEALTRERMLASARRLECLGIVPAGNADLVRRKFDDPLCLDVDRASRLHAGFSEDDIAYETARRRVSRSGGEP